MEENKDKLEPRKMSWNLHLCLQASVPSDGDDFQEKASIFCQSCTHTWKGEGGDLVGAIGVIAQV